MRAKSWRLGAETTTRSVLTARSVTTCRSACTFPVAQPARPRDQAAKLQIAAVQTRGAEHLGADSRYERGTTGGQVSLDTIHHAARAISEWISFYNHRRPYQALKMKTPAQAFALAA